MSDRLRRAYRFTVVPEPLIRDKRISDRAFRVWCILDRYAGANGAAFPTRRRLAEDLDCSLATLDRAILELVEYGWLTKQRRGEGESNDYTLVEVPEGGVLTHEDTPPVLTHEDTLSSPMTTGVLTHDAHKEASLRDASVKDADDSLRSSSGATKRAHRIPDDFAVTEDMKAWYAASGITGINPVQETAEFIDHFRASGKPGKDWVAAWRNWMRRAEKYAASHGGGRGARSNVHQLPANDPSRQRHESYFQTGVTNA